MKKKQNKKIARRKRYIKAKNFMKNNLSNDFRKMVGLSGRRLNQEIADSIAGKAEKHDREKEKAIKSGKRIKLK